MAYEKTEGIVLRKVNFSETSWIVTFLTPNRGRLACMVRGARRKGSPFPALLDTYNRVELTYARKESRQVQTLVEAFLLDSYQSIKSELDRTACAAIAAECALYLSRENDPGLELYQALAKGLSDISTRESGAYTGGCIALYGLLCAAGYSPRHGGPRPRSAALSQALEAMESGILALPDQTALDLLQFLAECICYHIERPLQSLGFLKKLSV